MFVLYLISRVLLTLSKRNGGKVCPLHLPGSGSPRTLIFSQLGFSISMFYEHAAPLSKPEGHQTTCRKHLFLGFM